MSLREKLCLPTKPLTVCDANGLTGVRQVQEADSHNSVWGRICSLVGKLTTKSLLSVESHLGKQISMDVVLFKLSTQ